MNCPSNEPQACLQGECSQGLIDAFRRQGRETVLPGMDGVCVP